MRSFLFICLFIGCLQSSAQTLGGSTVFNFLNLPNTPQLTAMGGINVSYTGNDVGLACNNPALLSSRMHAQMNAAFNSMYAGISAYHLSAGYHSPSLHTNFLWGLHFVNYGSSMQTDAAGNIAGSFRANDWVMQVSASRQYLQHWQYGATLKFISSNYGDYRSNGIAVDVGVVYNDSAAKFSAGLLAKNMGFQLKKYAGSSAEDLPFDMEIGITQKLQHAPFGFSLTAHHLHQFDIRYNDTTFNNENGISKKGVFFFDKLTRHFVAATHIYIGDKIDASIGYNHLRRQELKWGNGGNGLNGFSLGLGLVMQKFQVRYARGWYQHNTAYNQLGLNLKLNELIGLGKIGDRPGW